MVVRMPGVYALYAFRAEIDKPVQFPEIGFLVGELDVGKGNEPLRIFAACAEYCVVAGPCSLDVRTVAESGDAFVSFAVFYKLPDKRGIFRIEMGMKIKIHGILLSLNCSMII